MIVSLLLTCLLLGINGLIVSTMYAAMSEGLPDSVRQPRIAQAIVFLGPVLLLVLEWWIFDVALDWLDPKRRSSPSAGSQPRGL